jgi:hypothetical protein
MTARKPPSRRLNRNTKDVGVINEPGTAPTMPRGLCRQAQDAWTGYWEDDVSSIVKPSDLVLVHRWVRDLDRYYRLSAEADRQPFVKGSRGQDTYNTAYNLTAKLIASIREDEKQLGIGPLNRLRLGLVYGTATQTLADLTAEITISEEDDPRLTVVADVVEPMN